MKENIYKNPALIVWQARKNLMPVYLVIIWGALFAASLIGAFYKNYFDFSTLTLESHFSITSTGLTLTLALFVAGKSAFDDKELKILANHIPENGVKGQALIDFIGPYVFTSLLFFVTGLVSLFGPFLKLSFDPTILLIIKIIYFNILSLGFFSLFNLVITMLKDVYLKAFRK
ncbi:MAG TPA: hypothetical protein VNR61_13555 [Niallia sp.]|nr:hypothetical protein [Niallia sp.]